MTKIILPETPKEYVRLFLIENPLRGAVCGKFSAKSELGPTLLCPLSFQPTRTVKIDFEIFVKEDAQHDGHAWDDGYIENQYEATAEVILDLMKERILQTIKNIDPLGIHRK